MAFLAAGLVLVGALCLLDLLLTFGVLRRLREHSAVLATLTSRPPEANVLPVGSSVGDFSATTTSGGHVGNESLTAPTLVGFFSVGCGACEEQLPGFLERAETADRPSFAVVVGGDEAERSVIARRLEPVAKVVVEDSYGPVAEAFGVTAFPSFYALDETRSVAASGFELEALAHAR
jgi:hypothetical protein